MNAKSTARNRTKGIVVFALIGYGISILLHASIAVPLANFNALNVIVGLGPLF